MNNNYAFVFSVNGKVVWSGETAESLRSRMANTFDEDLVADFLESNPDPGSFIVLVEGDMVFRTCR